MKCYDCKNHSETGNPIYPIACYYFKPKIESENQSSVGIHQYAEYICGNKAENCPGFKEIIKPKHFSSRHKFLADLWAWIQRRRGLIPFYAMRYDAIGTLYMVKAVTPGENPTTWRIE